MVYNEKRHPSKPAIQGLHRLAGQPDLCGKGIQARLLPSQPLQPRLLIGFAGGRHSAVSNRILGILFSFFGSHVETTCT